MVDSTFQNKASFHLLQPLGTKPPWIMGILNVTPDSFSDGGYFVSAERAIPQGLQLVTQGAHIVDVGGESTRPGSRAVSINQELARVTSVVEGLVAKGIPVSIDTYKAEVAEAALRLGAVMVNDVSALRSSPRMASIVAQHDAFLLMMHSKERATHPHATNSERHYNNLIAEISEFLLKRAEYARSEGVSPNKIFLDPGIGKFISHEPGYSFELLARIPELVAAVYPYPVALGISRKGFLADVLKRETTGNTQSPADRTPADRDALSTLAALNAVSSGVSLIRTHRPDLLLSFLAINRVTNITG